MESYLKMGLKTLKYLLKVARSFGVKIIYKLSRRIKSGGFIATLTGTFDDDNACIIDSGPQDISCEKVENYKFHQNNHHLIQWSLEITITMQSKVLDLPH